MMNRHQPAGRLAIKFAESALPYVVLYGEPDGTISLDSIGANGQMDGFWRERLYSDGLALVKVGKDALSDLPGDFT